MSGPNPPGREPEEPDPAAEPSEPESLGEEFDGDLDDELNPVDDLDHADDFDDGGGHADATDAYSQAYSAPESELFVSGRYVPADLALYDYDGYEDFDDDHAAPRWPWVVGVTAILAAIALVAAVSVLVARTDTSKLASPGATTTTSSTPPVQDQITTTKPPPPSSEPPPTSVPPPPPSEVPTATETQTVTVTPAPAPAPVPPAPTSAPPPASSPAAAPPPVTTTTPAGPRQVTYSVTGTKAPGDIISVTYVDASGRRRTQHNVYIPWSMTVTPISQSDVGSVEASSLFRVSKLNCSIITSDGTVLSSNTNDSPQTSC